MGEEERPKNTKAVLGCHNGGRAPPPGTNATLADVVEDGRVGWILSGTWTGDDGGAVHA